MNLAQIQIKPITNQTEFEDATRMIDALIDADLIANPAERQQALAILEAISILAAEYEKKHFQIPHPNPLEAIKERMAQLKLTQKDVAAWFGGENRVSEVLSGKRTLTVKMIIALNKHLNISTDTLLGVGRPA